MRLGFTEPESRVTEHVGATPLGIPGVTRIPFRHKVRWGLGMPLPIGPAHVGQHWHHGFPFLWGKETLLWSDGQGNTGTNLLAFLSLSLFPFLLTGSYVAQAGFELMILMPQLPERWGYSLSHPS